MLDENLKLVVYDFETTGRNSNWDQIIQVGAVLVNLSFQEIDRIELRCSLKSGLIPEPGALLVNNSSTEMLKNSNLTHYYLIDQVIKKFQEWSPAIFIGYNSINFDEEFLRKTLFKTLYNPYFTQLNGNKRADILGMVRSACLYFPEALKYSTNVKGNPVLKLDEIAPMNEINHLAHDALGDVIATKEIGKILCKNANEIWLSGLKNASKSEVNQTIKNELLFCYNDYYYGKPKPFLLTHVCDHPVYQWPQCFDLVNDPKAYLNMSKNELSREISKSPKIIRSIKNNKNPIIMNYKNYSKFDNYNDTNENIYIERAKLIQNNGNFKLLLSTLLKEEHETTSDFESQEEIQAEESLYKGGFFSNSDKQIMEKFHKSEWDERLSICDSFNDERLFYFGMRLIFEEHPSTLPKDIYKNIHTSIAHQILSMNNEKWNTIPKACKESDDLKAKYENENNVEKLNQLKDFDKLISDIENQFL